jgi:hypothetical protein
LSHVRLGAVALLVVGVCLAGHAWSAPSVADCQSQVNNTEAKLLACIQEDDLWSHLTQFQTIATQNPFGGHANRGTGRPGYLASVNYVAGLMQAAGYRVTVQPYAWKEFRVQANPVFKALGQTYERGKDWFVARLSGSGSVSSAVEAVTPANANEGMDSLSGCLPADFAGFVRGNIALLQRGSCEFDTQVSNAQNAGAAGVIFFNSRGEPGEMNRGGVRDDGGAYEAHLTTATRIPVVGVVSNSLGAALLARYQSGGAPTARIGIRSQTRSLTDYNLIADSTLGDPDRVVVLEGHLDAIYGAGILDNASGSTTIIETALALAHTPTLNRMRYIWFGGEELGLFGSRYYTQNLSKKELGKIVFDIDADVTATPNYAVLIADPENAHNAKHFPPNVIPQSKIGDRDFLQYFRSNGIPALKAHIGNDGTDSNSFSLVGVPNTGLFTQQDCCKGAGEVQLWGGYLGDFEGKIPGRHGYCVDRRHHWCDNLDNNDPAVLEFASKAVAYVTFALANDASLGGAHVR